MASDVQVHACNTPGGAVFEWRDDVGDRATNVAIGFSPVGLVADAGSRGGVVGTFKASWGWDRVGSNGHTVRATIYNGSDHAEFVEFGRGPSGKRQVFTWSVFGGDWVTAGPGNTDMRMTGGFEGQHVLQRAINAVLGEATGGAYTPI
jgi:hypothetical protein